VTRAEVVPAELRVKFATGPRVPERGQRHGRIRIALEHRAVGREHLAHDPRAVTPDESPDTAQEILYHVVMRRHSAIDCKEIVGSAPRVADSRRAGGVCFKSDILSVIDEPGERHPASCY